jgi:hypothetical protein
MLSAALVCPRPGKFDATWYAADVGFHSPDPGSPINCTFPLAGYSLPTMADLLALTAGWNTPAANGSPPSDVIAWLTNETGPGAMPNYGGPVPPASNFLQGPFGRAGSNGTLWALWSSDCSYDGNLYIFNGPVGYGSSVYYGAAGRFTSCQILDLATGTTTVECIADFEDVTGQLGCETPLSSVNTYNGPITGHNCAPCGLYYYGQYVLGSGAQLDYFHPNLLLGWRMPNAGEQYWTAP